MSVKTTLQIVSNLLLYATCEHDAVSSCLTLESRNESSVSSEGAPPAGRDYKLHFWKYSSLHCKHGELNSTRPNSQSHGKRHTGKSGNYAQNASIHLESITLKKKVEVIERMWGGKCLTGFKACWRDETRFCPPWFKLQQVSDLLLVLIQIYPASIKQTCQSIKLTPKTKWVKKQSWWVDVLLCVRCWMK